VKLTARAPGKVNLCLFLGPVRKDGRHELVTLYESVSLADDVTVTPAEADQVVCAGVHGVNIVTQTLDGLRACGWDGPPLRVVIEKRIPVAGGMGGGSADAAAVLRLAAGVGPVPSPTAVGELACALGTDVPSQLTPGLSLGTGAGDFVELLFEPLAPHAFVIVPQPIGLSTVEVYREADRLGLPRDRGELADRLSEVRAALAAGTDLPLVNDLELAALSLAPEIGRALDAVRDAGAAHAIVSGSGPTVFGIWWGAHAPRLAQEAAETLVDRYPEATPAAPVSEEFGAPRGS
jgi:4-diphosphocytidyl-2-C-methyl-D-erythritol kinase